MSSQGPDHQRDQQIQNARDTDGARQSESADQQKAADQHAYGGAQAVGEIHHGQGVPRTLRGAANEAGAHQRKGCSQQQCLGQYQQRGQRPLEPEDEQRRSERRQHGVVGERQRRHEHLVEPQRHDADQSLCRCIAKQQAAPGGAIAACQPGAGSQPAHENG